MADLASVRDALLGLLARSQPIKFAAVKPLLGRSLNHTFDPTRFDCLDTGDFLRRYGQELGVAVRKGEHDWEIVLASNDRAEPSLDYSPCIPAYGGAPDYRDLLRARRPTRLFSAVCSMVGDHGMSISPGVRRWTGTPYCLLLRSSSYYNGRLRTERHDRRGAPRKGRDVSGIQSRLSVVQRRLIGAEELRDFNSGAACGSTLHWSASKNCDGGREHSSSACYWSDWRRHGLEPRIDAGRLAELLYGQAAAPEQVQELQETAERILGERRA